MKFFDEIKVRRAQNTHSHTQRKTSFLILSKISRNVNFEHNHKRTPPTKAKS